MKCINLKLFYSNFYKTDTYIEVTEEIAEILKQFDRQFHASNERIRVNKAYFSLDLNDGIERACIHMSKSTEELYEEKVEIITLYKAILQLPEKQMKRIYAHFFLGLGYSKIAKLEGVNKSVISRSISRGLMNLKKYIKNL